MRRKILYIVLGVILIGGLIAYFYGNKIATNKIDSLIKEKLPENIQLTYSNISTDVVRGRASLEDVQLKLIDKGIDINFDELNISGIKTMKLLNSDTILIGNISLVNGNVEIDNSKKQTKKTKDSLKKEQKKIIINKVNLTNTDFLFKDKNGKLQVQFENSDAFFTDFVALTAPNENENAISYNFVNFLSDSLKYPMGNLETLTVNKVEIDTTQIKLTDVIIKPNFSRTEYQKQIKEEKDVINLVMKEMILENYNYSFENENSFITADKVILNSADLNVFRDKAPPDQTPYKPLYSERLRNLKMGLNLKKIEIKNTKVTYEEKDEHAHEPGKIFLANLNGTISNINNMEKGNDLVKIDVKSGFMKSGKADIQWEFNIHQPADKFNIKGHVSSLNAADLNLFFVPSLHMTATGEVQDVFFNFNGNNGGAEGQMEMKYEDFKIAILNEETGEKKGVLSAIANIFVKNDKDNLNSGDMKIAVVRDQQKSFFNLFWLCLREGIKQNFLKNKKN